MLTPLVAGNAINRPGQLSLRGGSTFFNNWPDGSVMLSTGGTYAPTIRHHIATGRTYILCTNVIHNSAAKADGEHGHNFIVHTTDVRASVWSDPVYYDFEGIDPSIFFDDDTGRVYIQGSRTPDFQIYNMEVDLTDPSRVRVVAPPRLLWAGWDRRYTESPHLHKKDGWWYLVCAEGGTFDTHMISAARARDVWGPYEACPHNPVLTAHGTDRYVQNTGHADLFQDGGGRWWAVMLGVRQRGNRFPMGRETFLSEVEWEDGGWPVVRPVVTESVGRSVGARQSDAPITADAGVDWVYLRDPDLGDFEINGDTVTVVSSETDLRTPMDPVSFVGKRQRVLDGQSSVRVHLGGGEAGQGARAGLALFKDEHRFASIGYDFATGEVVAELLNAAKGRRETQKKEHPVAAAGSIISFRIVYSEVEYELAFQDAEGNDWISLLKFDTLDITGFDFTGPIIGIFATGAKGQVVRFETFKID